MKAKGNLTIEILLFVGTFLNCKKDFQFVVSAVANIVS
jgi:hypothetical protein